MSNQLGFVDEAAIEFGPVDFFEEMIEAKVRRDLTGHATWFAGRDEKTVVVGEGSEEINHPRIDRRFELATVVETFAVMLDRCFAANRVRVAEENLEGPAEGWTDEGRQLGMGTERFAHLFEGVVHARKEAGRGVGDGAVEVEEDRCFQSEEIVAT